jgi:hypothetical protein
MSERPVSRQPSCRYCEHEEHVYSRCLLELAGAAAMCPCPPHLPPGIYP